MGELPNFECLYFEVHYLLFWVKFILLSTIFKIRKIHWYSFLTQSSYSNFHNEEELHKCLEKSCYLIWEFEVVVVSAVRSKIYYIIYKHVMWTTPWCYIIILSLKPLFYDLITETCTEAKPNQCSIPTTAWAECDCTPCNSGSAGEMEAGGSEVKGQLSCLPGFEISLDCVRT